MRSKAPRLKSSSSYVLDCVRFPGHSDTAVGMARRGDSDASGGGWVRVIDESHLVVESEIARGSFGVMMKATMNGTQSVALKVRPTNVHCCMHVHVY